MMQQPPDGFRLDPELDDDGNPIDTPAESGYGKLDPEDDGLDAILDDIEFDHNDPMVRAAARAILARSIRDGVHNDMGKLTYVSIRLAEAAIDGLVADGWF